MIAFSIWSIHIYRYGIFYFITSILWYGFLRWVGQKWWFKKYVWIQTLLTKGIDDLILATIIGVLVWGRLWHVFLYDRDYYSKNIGEIFQIRHGGMSFVWWIFGVVIAIFIVERIFKLTRKEFFIIFDLLLLVVPIGIFLGRIWNYLNQELYGILVPESRQRLENFWITHRYPLVDNALRFNTNFLAALFEWLIMWITIVILFYWQQFGKKRKPWLISVTFIIFYSIVRFCLEFLRQDSQSEYIGNLTTTQRIMAILLWFGFVVWFMYQDKNKE